jgi:hypothetical protein
MTRNNLALDPRGWIAGYVEAWDQFWFTPRLPHTLAVLRILTGAFLLYSHLVLASDLDSFLGDNAWINNDTARALHDGTFGTSDAARSYLWAISNPLLIWLHHGVTIAISTAFLVGFMTRITAPLAWFLQIMYLHRLTGALFGFDQIITYATMYLMIAPCGSCFSVDARLRERWSEQRKSNRRLAWLLPEAVPSVTANIATRLLQLHLCVIYLFGGLAKARGQSWWDGTAVWYSVGNYEYQSIDMTWISRFPRIFTAMSHATMFWEIFYCAIVWPKRTRPIVLAIAVAVHGGIALFLGMMTFGMMMIVANGVFVEPETVRRWLRLDDATDQTAGEEPLNGQFKSHTPAIAKPIDTSTETPAQRNEREAQLYKREKQVRTASRRLRDRKAKLKEREIKYRERVKNLKRRETRIKELIERKRAAKARKDPDQE